jgi:CelD/BcsL family acetyltransferase involved in cellulose biosynthesis
MDLQINTLSDFSALKSLFPEWDSLQAQIIPRTPFNSPTWFEAWWQHYRRRTSFTRDRLFVHTLRDVTGQLIGVAPFMITCRPSFGPLRVRLLQFFGADPAITELKEPICRREHQGLVIRTLIDKLVTDRSEWDLLRWSGIQSSALAANALTVLGQFHEHHTVPCYILTLPESWSQLLDSVSSNMRKNIRKTYELLYRDGHTLAFNARNCLSNLGETLDTFYSLHAARASARDMILHPDCFSIRTHRILLSDVARQMTHQNKLRMLQLKIGESVVASRVAFCLGDDLYLYYSGFDPAWRKYGVMTALMCETLKWAINEGIKRVNLSTGKDFSKLRWRPDEILYHNVLQASPTWRGRLALCAYRADFRRD